MGNRNIEYENPEISNDKRLNLENSIRNFIQNQNEKIKLCFEKKDYKRQRIDSFKIGNDSIQKNEDFGLTDYAIQWSIGGNNEINSTNCHLTFFNIGSLLGSDGFLYSICLFYYYFMKIQIKNRKKYAIMNDIEMCLNYIDNSNIQELNNKWRIELDDNLLNNLKVAKDFLMNLFQEKLTDDIFDKINNTVINKIYRACKSFAKGVSKFVSIIFFGIICKLSEREEEEKTRIEKEEIYIKRKNAINKQDLFNLILNSLNYEFFSENNIFILATDDNTVQYKNCGTAFIGDYIEGLGQMHRARKLIKDKDDGFIIGNNKNCENNFLYDYYYKRIIDIKLFFERNQKTIDIIKKGINKGLKDSDIQNFSQEIDYINNEFLQREGSIDNEIKTEITRETINTNPIVINRLSNEQIKNAYEQIKINMGDERAMEALRLSNLIEKNSYSYIDNGNLNENLIDNSCVIANNKENQEELEYC